MAGRPVLGRHIGGVETRIEPSHLLCLPVRPATPAVLSSHAASLVDKRLEVGVEHHAVEVRVGRGYVEKGGAQGRQVTKRITSEADD